MGKKYASIHIFTNGLQNILPDVINYFKKDKFRVKKIEALNMIKDETVRQMIGNLPGFLSNEILIIQSDLFISIYDEGISFETIEETAKALSKTVGKPLLYFSNFDDGVFIFGGFQSGRLISSRILGDDLEAYGNTPSRINSIKLCNTFPVFNKDFIENLNTIGTIDIIEDEIEECLKSPLSMKLCNIQDSNKNYIEINHEDGIYIYKVV